MLASEKSLNESDPGFGESFSLFVCTVGVALREEGREIGGLEGRNAGPSSSSSGRGCRCCSCCWKSRSAAAEELLLSPEDVEARLSLVFLRSGTNGEETEDCRRGKEV
jgi:hypothetical protein